MSEDQGQVRDVELDAEAQARRRFALAQIRQYPDPVLRMEAKPVEEFDADLLGPAPLLRLRGRYRAQLVAKTDQPRRLAARAGRLLSAAAPAMRRAGLAVVVDVDPQSL